MQSIKVYPIDAVYPILHSVFYSILQEFYTLFLYLYLNII